LIHSMSNTTDQKSHSSASLLVIGFDSAWSPMKQGAIAGALIEQDGSITEMATPQSNDTPSPVVVGFQQARQCISAWQEDAGGPGQCSTLIFIDQPIIVENQTGQRPVEHIVSSPVGRCGGGVQPANRQKTVLFGDDAPIREFLHDCCLRWAPLVTQSAHLPGLRGLEKAAVAETYPALAMISMGWLLSSSVASEMGENVGTVGRIPKYNPRNKNFSRSDWNYVCRRTANGLRERRLVNLAEWAQTQCCTDDRSIPKPRKQQQDKLDACICLLVALHFSAGERSLFVGNTSDGYMLVPYGSGLHEDLIARCCVTNRDPAEWVRVVHLQPSERW